MGQVAKGRDRSLQHQFAEVGEAWGMVMLTARNLQKLKIDEGFEVPR